MMVEETQQEERDRRERIRRLADVKRGLANLKDDELPPLPLLFRLSELGIRNAALERVSVLRRRVEALERLYDGRNPERRQGPRRDEDRG
jgi:hypothetical protein